MMNKEKALKALKRVGKYTAVYVAISSVIGLYIGLKSSREILSDDTETVSTGEYREIIIKYAPTYVSTLCSSYSVVQKIFDTITIYVDKKFEKLSKSQKQFVINHELGHINCGHLDQIAEENKNKNIMHAFINKDRLAGKEIAVVREMEADEYAASIVGYDVAIETLKIMDRNIHNRVSRKEMARRIKNLEDKKGDK